ncbi:MAG: ABC transporter ATP-binding protein/permease [Lachnospiraceae bacterium]|nr:ABC transporter ATP-binding protein/permease [Lachnospiraceae bacterium]
MKSLWKYFKNYKKECVLGPLFKLLEASFELIVPLVVARIVDIAIPSENSGYLIRMCLIMVLLGLVGLGCSLTAQYFSAKAAVGFAAGVKKALFSHVQSLPYQELDRLGTSTLITRLTADVNQMQSGVNMALRLFLRSPFIVFGAMIMAFTINVKAAITFVVVIPALSIVVYGIMLGTIPLYKKVQGKLDKVTGVTRSNLNGVRVIRAFCREETEQKEFAEANTGLTKMQIVVGRISALMNPLTYAIINAGLIWLIYKGAVQVDGGIITQGSLIALVNYMSQILVELVKLANLMILETKSLASAGRIEEVLLTQSSMEEGSVQAEHLIGSVCFDHVSLTYKGCQEEALSDIHFALEPGETLGIIGGTGCGKTSVVNLISRYYDVSKGAVLVDGKDVKEYTFASLREQIASVPQKAVLFSGSLRKNLLWGKSSATEEELLTALERAQAKEFVLAKEGGLDQEVAQGGKNYSGGQRQRLTIARALVKEAPILILDDSASALDYVTDANLRKSIHEMNPRPTTIIVSQRTASVMSADKILVLDDGKQVGIGTHEELLKNCEVYQEIYASQFKTEEEMR